MGSYFWQSNYNWVVDRNNTPVEGLIRSQIRVKKIYRPTFFSFQTVYVYSLKFQITAEKICSSFDLPFGTIMTKFKLFHVVENKMYHARQTFEINCHF